MKTIYRSKVGTTLLFFIAGILALSFLIMLLNHAWAGAIVIALVTLFIYHMYTNTWYEINGKMLLIKCGFLYKLNIDITTINKVTETNNPISSPATSLDRLEIRFRKWNSVLISPKEKQQFIQHLRTINPDIEVKLKRKN